MKAPGRRWEWIGVDRILGEAGILKDSSAGRRHFETMMEQRRTQEAKPGDWQAVRRGWFLGDAQFKKELLAQMHDGFGAHHGGEEREESCQAQAERVLAAELKRLRWTKEDLAKRRKGGVGKARLAQRLRKETTMRLVWIAERLHMGSASTVAHCVRKTADCRD